MTNSKNIKSLGIALLVGAALNFAFASFQFVNRQDAFQFTSGLLGSLAAVLLAISCFTGNKTRNLFAGLGVIAFFGAAIFKLLSLPPEPIEASISFAFGCIALFVLIQRKSHDIG